MYKALQWKILLLFCWAFLASCAPATPTASTPVTDEEMSSAIDKANQTIETLFKAMLAPKPSYDFMGVKVRFSTQDGGYDDNWVEPIDYHDGKFTVRMIDGLTYSPNQHPDRVLDVPRQKVVDWVIIEKDGTVIGGYTIKLAYEHMSPAEKKEFLRVTGYKLN